MHKFRLLILAILCCCAHHALAADITALAEAIDQGRTDEALPELRIAAEAGDAAALSLLAALYQRGEGVSKNAQRAIELYRLAAELGDAEAQFNLGNIYLLGEGVPADEAWALTYYRQAAKQGHELATRNMNQLYRASGITPPTPSAPSAQAVAEAAMERANAEPEVAAVDAVDEQALAPTTRIDPDASATIKQEARPQSESQQEPVVAASSNAGTLSDDEREAIRLAEQHGVAVALDQSGAAEATANPASEPSVGTAGASPSGSSVQLISAATGDLQGLQQLADGEDAAAQYELAQSYLSGRGTPQNVDQGVSWLERAAANNHTQAQFDLGQRYLLGAGVKPDDAMAITLFRSAARTGHLQATERLTAIYADAGLPPPDLSRPRRQIAPTTNPLSAVAAAPSSAPREAYDYAVVDHEQTAPPKVDASEIDPAPPRDHEVISGGALAQSDANALSEAELNAEPEATDASLQSTPTAALVQAAAPQDQMHRVEDARSDAVRLEAQAAAEAEAARLEAQALIAAEAARLEAQAQAEAEAARLEAQALIAAEAARLEAQAQAEAEAARLEAQAQAEAEAARLEAQAQAEAEAARLEAQAQAEAEAARLEAQALIAAEAARLEAQAEAEAAQMAARTSRVANRSDDDGSDGSVTGALAAGVTAAGTAGAVAANRSGAGSIDAATRVAASAAPKEKKRGILGSLRDALVNNEAQEEGFVSRAPGGNEAVRAGNPQIMEAEDKLAMADNASVDPTAPKPTLAEAEAALGAGDHARAAEMFTVLANDGDAEAQAHIGYMTYQGEGVPRDKAKAVEWYRRSAVQGNRDAQYNLAVAYAFGEGVPQDDAEAVVWYRRAAEQGNAIAQYSLGVSYALGEGVAQDDAEASRWYREAAQQGYPAAQYNLAYMYRAGKGLDQNDAEALRWFLLAAQNGHASAQYSLGYMYRSGKGVERNIDEAIRWYRLAAAQGHAEARADLSSLVPDN